MKELPKAFVAKSIEEKWYSFWESHKFFHADASSQKKPYCIVIPPPNVTGVLHMGHALVDTLQDILIRWKRMQGFEALWVPGTDHAGIATQTVVERHLLKTTGKRRKDFSREEFLEHVWDWKEKSQHQILGQLKKLGCSCDWQRLRFTMDEENNLAVRTAFKKMYDDGLIYQGDYLVNWDPIQQTALSDDEVETEEKDSFLWHIKYPLANGKGHLVVATTRPETMLGDVAVAVHPEDERYKKWIGEKILLPLTDRQIPIIADSFVDKNFGSGAVKITPAHDFTDFEVGKNHGFSSINIMTADGHINENGGKYAGLTMDAAREAVLADLKKENLLVRAEPHKLRIGHSYRSKAVIQPYLSKQWFVKMSVFKNKLIQIVKDKKVELIPPHWESTYYHWIENLRDWCISRQIWWGHRIPIWYNKSDRSKMICYAESGTPPEVAKNPDLWEQDSDVLDTWFSSALWPFAVLGWPHQTEELKKFYPTSVLVTGHDILFFWVARMILMGEYALEEVPFHQAFLHGLIYGKSYWRKNQDGSIAYLPPEEKKKYDLGAPLPSDVESKWEKMSKSKGNIIDPLEIIDEYGTDAMRLALCSSVTHARQIDLDLRKFEEFKNFANKVWNGARFVFMNLEDCTSEILSEGLDLSLLTLEDKWILSLLNKTIREINDDLGAYSFDKAATRAYEFFWNDFCANYVELAKPALFGKTGTPAHRANKQRMLVILLTNAIRLLHPISPFITEEIFSLLKEKFPGLAPSKKRDPYTEETILALLAPACIKAPYPTLISEKDISAETEKTFSFILEMIQKVRNIRAEMQMPPSEKTELLIYAPASEELRDAQEHQNILLALTPTSSITFLEEDSGSFGASSLVGSLKLTIPIPESLKEKEKARLLKTVEKLEKNQASTKAKLANEEFCSKAPAHVVEQLRAQLAQTEKELEEISIKLKTL